MWWQSQGGNMPLTSVDTSAPLANSCIDNSCLAISQICNEIISGNGSSVNSRICSTFNTPLPASRPSLRSKVREDTGQRRQCRHLLKIFLCPFKIILFAKNKKKLIQFYHLKGYTGEPDWSMVFDKIIQSIH